jgi:hypothetical protein
MYKIIWNKKASTVVAIEVEDNDILYCSGKAKISKVFGIKKPTNGH